jgi:hypothetical protein
MMTRPTAGAGEGSFSFGVSVSHNILNSPDAETAGPQMNTVYSGVLLVVEIMMNFASRMSAFMTRSSGGVRLCKR